MFFKIEIFESLCVPATVLMFYILYCIFFLVANQENKVYFLIIILI